MKIGLMLTAVAAIAMLAGCRITVPDDLGRQVGEVTKVYPAGTLPATYPDCLIDLPEGQDPVGRYVEIRFGGIQSYRHVNAFVPTVLDIREADRVEVHHPYCAGVHKPGIERLLAAASGTGGDRVVPVRK